MREPVQFFVRGHPKAQGSKKHVGGGVMVEMSKDLGPWRRAIADEAHAARNGSGVLGPPLQLRVVFFFSRPKIHYGQGRNAGTVKASAPKYRDANPDLDKLCRAVGDALTMGGLILDDRHIVRLEAEKRYGDPGVLVEVKELE